MDASVSTIPGAGDAFRRRRYADSRVEEGLVRSSPSALSRTFSPEGHRDDVGNVAEEVLNYDTQLRQARSVRQSLGGLPKAEQNPGSPPFFRLKANLHEIQN